MTEIMKIEKFKKENNMKKKNMLIRERQKIEASQRLFEDRIWKIKSVDIETDDLKLLAAKFGLDIESLQQQAASDLRIFK
jgi:hypothetical protein